MNKKQYQILSRDEPFLKIIIQIQAFKELSKNPLVKCFVQHSVCSITANGKKQAVEGRTFCCHAEECLKEDCHLRMSCQQ